jgi:fructose-1,6-bisphosphatase/sedoheptulose 1,7-bisphosphatase-like protein
MEKIAIGPGYPDGTISLAKSVTDNVARSRRRKCASSEVIACVLDQPRHDAIIAELRALGCGIKLIPDGDVAGVIATSIPILASTFYLGTGGAAGGVLAAAALRCVGGQMQGRLIFRNDDGRGRAPPLGIDDLDRIYAMEDMAKGDCIFAATGVTDGSMLDGVKRQKGGMVTTEHCDARQHGHGPPGFTEYPEALELRPRHIIGAHDSPRHSSRSSAGRTAYRNAMRARTAAFSLPLFVVSLIVDSTALTG